MTGSGPYTATLHRGGELHPDAQVHYATSWTDQAAEYGAPYPVHVTFQRPLHVTHQAGVSWRDRLEQLTGGAGWLNLLSNYDGIVYHWPAGGTHWRTGQPQPAHDWAIGRPGTITAA